jgi:hypothetical protein
MKLFVLFVLTSSNALLSTLSANSLDNEFTYTHTHTPTHNILQISHSLDLVQNSFCVEHQTQANKHESHGIGSTGMS